MSLIIASQFEESFNEALRAHALQPTIVTLGEERPWEAAADADVLLVRPSSGWRGALGSARPAGWPGRARWVHSGSAGVDFYPAWLLEAPVVSCGRGVAADEIADYVIAAIYAQAKDLEGVRARSLAQWVHASLGRVAGATVGLIGFGAIGEAVARRALALGMRVVAARRRSLPSAVDGVELVVDLAEVAAAADHLVLALPATPATRRIVGADLLARAKPTAHLINIARGSVLDQDALLEALDAGRLAFATLDVTEPEPLPESHRFWTHPRVRLTPHVSSNYMRVRDRQLEQVVTNLERFARGEAPTGLVDSDAGY